MAPSSKNQVFSANQIAKICGVVNQTVINWIRDGHLVAFRTPGNQYRVYKDELLKFLEKRQIRIPDYLNDDNQNSTPTYKLLIVDDDEEINNLIYRFIIKKFKNFDIRQAYNGFEAGKLLASHKPDIVLLDIDLPGLNGHELCRQIKNDSEFGSPIVFVITGLDSDDDREKILEEGADDFFGKPIDFDLLYKKIKKVMRI
ncbi:response regulator [Spirochaetia bacterium 38H-sp]|uniref:Response regulator n=1 Tax=Rarispira pelagica TaxID=3141764 RepID=A0ABU9UA60_9SPIR